MCTHTYDVNENGCCTTFTNFHPDATQSDLEAGHFEARSRFDAPLSALSQVALALASKTERVVQLPCDSGQYTDSGECCLECPPGEGVVKKCGATQTVCSQCLDSE